MKLKLNRPLIAFDLETTGINTQVDEIIELYAIKLYPNEDKEIYHSFFLPDVEISPDATRKHKLQKEDLIGQPKFKTKAKEIFDFFNDCDLLAYNGLKFDIPFITQKFMECDIIYNPRKFNILDPYDIICKLESRSLETIYEKYFNEKFDGSHSAEFDVKATIKVMEKQIEVFNLSPDVNEISKIVCQDKSGNELLDFGGWFYSKNDDYYFARGKHVGELIKNHTSYLEWIIEKSNLPFNTKYIGYLIKNKITAKV